MIKNQFDKAKSEESVSKDNRKNLKNRFKDLTAQAYDLDILIEK